MRDRVQLGDMTVEVVRKKIRNVHLSVHPPTGRVTISAPARLTLDTIRVFAVSKLQWIRKQQRKMQEQDREPPREGLERESHYVWGRRCLLKINEADEAPSVAVTPNSLVLLVRPGTQQARRLDVLHAWYRDEVRREALPLIDKWQALMGVRVRHLYVRRMRTKWGSCNYRAGTIRLNTDLARKARECLEYVVVHELVHLLEPSHNERFVTLMDRFLPSWRQRRDVLNRLPVRHEEWTY